MGPILLAELERLAFHGDNGMCDIDVWEPNFPDVSEIIHPTNAVQMIRDLIMQVKMLQNSEEVLKSSILI